MPCFTTTRIGCVSGAGCFSSVNGSKFVARIASKVFLPWKTKVFWRYVEKNLSTQIKTLTPRGIHLAQLFMQGVEHAFFANDACGAPIPWVMCCPWLFFDGKLFQMKLDVAERKRTLLEICGGQVSLVVCFLFFWRFDVWNIISTGWTSYASWTYATSRFGRPFSSLYSICDIRTGNEVSERSLASGRRSTIRGRS